MTQPMVAADLSFDVHHTSPLLIVVSGPSGAGKDAVLAQLRQRLASLQFVVTATDRKPRENERNGVDYILVTKYRFEVMIARDELLEYSIVYRDYKGIPKDQVQQAYADGKDVILRIDVQGAQKIKNKYPDAVLIFLVPEDVNEWLARLTNRGTETPESLRVRVETARWEISMLDIFDYVVVNAHDRLGDAVDSMVSIICAEHHRVTPRKIEL